MHLQECMESIAERINEPPHQAASGTQSALIAASKAYLRYSEHTDSKYKRFLSFVPCTKHFSVRVKCAAKMNMAQDLLDLTVKNITNRHG